MSERRSLRDEPCINYTVLDSNSVGMPHGPIDDPVDQYFMHSCDKPSSTMPSQSSWSESKRCMGAMGVDQLLSFHDESTIIPFLLDADRQAAKNEVLRALKVSFLQLKDISLSVQQFLCWETAVIEMIRHPHPQLVRLAEISSVQEPLQRLENQSFARGSCVVEKINNTLVAASEMFPGDSESTFMQNGVLTFRPTTCTNEIELTQHITALFYKYRTWHSTFRVSSEDILTSTDSTVRLTPRTARDFNLKTLKQCQARIVNGILPCLSRWREAHPGEPGKLIDCRVARLLAWFLVALTHVDCTGKSLIHLYTFRDVGLALLEYWSPDITAIKVWSYSILIVLYPCLAMKTLHSNVNWALFESRNIILSYIRNKLNLSAAVTSEIQATLSELIVFHYAKEEKVECLMSELMNSDVINSLGLLSWTTAYRAVSKDEKNHTITGFLFHLFLQQHMNVRKGVIRQSDCYIEPTKCRKFWDQIGAILSRRVCYQRTLLSLSTDPAVGLYTSCNHVNTLLATLTCSINNNDHCMTCEPYIPTSIAIDRVVEILGAGLYQITLLAKEEYKFNLLNVYISLMYKVDRLVRHSEGFTNRDPTIYKLLIMAWSIFHSQIACNLFAEGIDKQILTLPLINDILEASVYSSFDLLTSQAVRWLQGFEYCLDPNMVEYSRTIIQENLMVVPNYDTHPDSAFGLPILLRSLVPSEYLHTDPFNKLIPNACISANCSLKAKSDNQLFNRCIDYLTGSSKYLWNISASQMREILDRQIQADTIHDFMKKAEMGSVFKALSRPEVVEHLAALDFIQDLCLTIVRYTSIKDTVLNLTTSEYFAEFVGTAFTTVESLSELWIMLTSIELLCTRVSKGTLCSALIQAIVRVNSPELLCELIDKMDSDTPIRNLAVRKIVEDVDFWSLLPEQSETIWGFVLQCDYTLDESLFEVIAMRMIDLGVDLEKYVELLARFKEQDVLVTNLVAATLLLIYAHSGKIDIANQVWRDIHNRRDYILIDGIEYTSVQLSSPMYSSYVQALMHVKMNEDAMAILDEAKAASVSVSGKVYVCVVKYLMKDNDIQAAIEFIRDHVPPNALDLQIMNKLMRRIVNNGDMDQALKLFDVVISTRAVKPDIVTFNTLVRGYCKIKQLDKAFEIADLMTSSGIEYDIIFVNTLLHGCTRSGDAYRVAYLLNILEHSNLVPSSITLTILVQWHNYRDNIDEAIKLVDTWPVLYKFELDLQVCTAIISACLNRKRQRDVWRLYQNIPTKVKKDLSERFYNALVGGLVQADCVREAFAVVEDIHSDKKVVNFTTSVLSKLQRVVDNKYIARRYPKDNKRWQELIRLLKVEA